MNLQLRQIRESRGLTQGELAKQVGTTLRKISAWERQETALPLEMAVTFAEFFGCTLDELAGRWEYVGGYADERQRRLNAEYQALDEPSKDNAVAAVSGMAAASK